MKINRYKLKPNITTSDLIALNAREGGIWINKESKLFLSKCFYYKPYEIEFSIGIAFKDNIHDWNDFDNILVLDEDFTLRSMEICLEKMCATSLLLSL